MTTDIDQLLQLAEETRRDHLCPGCFKHVRRGQVGCDTCWKRIPTKLREPLRRAFRSRESDPLGYARAVAQARQLIGDYQPRNEVR